MPWKTCVIEFVCDNGSIGTGIFWYFLAASIDCQAWSESNGREVCFRRDLSANGKEIVWKHLGMCSAFAVGRDQRPAIFEPEHISNAGTSPFFFRTHAFCAASSSNENVSRDGSPVSHSHEEFASHSVIKHLLPPANVSRKLLPGSFRHRYVSWTFQGS